MLTGIYIVSGFLGAGKTTLIQKLLKEAFKNDKVVLIENDFGEISVDAALLKAGGIEVKEINSGCICCSLSGDFIKAVGELVERFHPDKIIIEPSGVGKLSDIIEACENPRLKNLAEVRRKITVADVKRCKMYLDNFGQFFEDQIKNADVIMLSRTADYPDKVKAAQELIKGLNSHSVILAKPWDRIDLDEILFSQHTREEHGECCGHGHSCHHHDEGHRHSAEDTFDTITIRTNRVFSADELKMRIKQMEQSFMGKVLRAKGIVRGPKGYINLQYLPGDIHITSCATGGDMLCIIGRDLNRQELVSLFSGE